MVDLYLQALMHASLRNPVKDAMESDRFGKELNRELEALSEEMLDEMPNATVLMSKPARKRQLKERLHQEFAMEALFQDVQEAIQVLRRDSRRYLENEGSGRLMQELDRAAEKMATIECKGSLDYASLLNLSETFLESIFKIAQAKFGEGIIGEGAALLSLLTCLFPGEWDVWFRLGIIRMKMGLFDCALQAFAVATSLNPSLYEARLLAAHCYLELGMKEEAGLEYREVNGTELPEELSELSRYLKSELTKG